MEQDSETQPITFSQIKKWCGIGAAIGAPIISFCLLYLGKSAATDAEIRATNESQKTYSVACDKEVMQLQHEIELIQQNREDNKKTYDQRIGAIEANTSSNSLQITQLTSKETKSESTIDRMSDKIDTMNKTLDALNAKIDRLNDRNGGK